MTVCGSIPPGEAVDSKDLGEWFVARPQVMAGFPVRIAARALVHVVSTATAFCNIVPLSRSRLRFFKIDQSDSAMSLVPFLGKGGGGFEFFWRKCDEKFFRDEMRFPKVFSARGFF